MQKEDKYWIKKAIQLAIKAEKSGEVPVGAILVSNDKIISKGFNSPISKCDPTSHAEIVAIRKAAIKIKNYRLPNTTLYVTLEPCAMCVGAILHARIKRLVFGAYDPKSGAVASVFRLLDEQCLNHRVEYCGGILADECSALLTNFFLKRRIK